MGEPRPARSGPHLKLADGRVHKKGLDSDVNEQSNNMNGTWHLSTSVITRAAVENKSISDVLPKSLSSARPSLCHSTRCLHYHKLGKMKRKLVSPRVGTTPPNLPTDLESWEQTPVIDLMYSKNRSHEKDPLSPLVQYHTNNSVVAILRKIVWLVARDVRESPHGNVFLDLVKDVAYGTLCGVFFVL